MKSYLKRKWGEDQSNQRKERVQNQENKEPKTWISKQKP